jgi:DnaJ-class molecular chaperone
MRLVLNPEEAGESRPSKGEAPPAYRKVAAKHHPEKQAGVAPRDEDRSGRHFNVSEFGGQDVA